MNYLRTFDERERQAIEDAYKDIENFAPCRPQGRVDYNQYARLRVCADSIVSILTKVFREGKYKDAMIECICAHDNPRFAYALEIASEHLEDSFFEADYLIMDYFDEWIENVLKYNSRNMINFLSGSRIPKRENTLSVFEMHKKYMRQQFIIETFSFFS